jgi:dihydroorotase
MTDLLIKNGIIVTSQGLFEGDLAVDQGVISAIGNRGHLPDAQEVLDASGLHILPGLVDDHIHFREPGMGYKEDFETGSRAAAAGGVTTVFDMPNTSPPLTSVDQFHEKLELIQDRAFVDFGLYAALVAENLGQLVDLAEAGVIGYKLYMGETTGYVRCPDDGVLYQAFKEVRQAGLRVGAHAENDWILQHMKASLIEAGRTDARAHLDSRPAFAEAEAISRALILSEAAGNPFHVFHLSTRDGLELVKTARRKGLPVTCEVLVGHLLFDDEAYEKHGNLIRLNPPIREKEHQEALWEGIQRGWIDIIATDHAPHSHAEKTAENVWDAACGFIGVETALPLMLSQVNKGRLSLEQYVRLACENPARTWGIYPQKGVIQIGADADLVLVDLAMQDTIEAKKLHNKNTLTPYEGWKVQGIPVTTILRGQVIMRDREILGAPRGALVKPKRQLIK